MSRDSSFDITCVGVSFLTYRGDEEEGKKNCKKFTLEDLVVQCYENPGGFSTVVSLWWVGGRYPVRALV